MKLEITRQGKITIIKIEGDINIDDEIALERELCGFADKGERCLVLDLSSMSFISSANLRVFLQAFKHIARLGGKLKLACLQPFVSRVIRTANLNQVFEIHSTLNDAIHSFH